MAQAKAQCKIDDDITSEDLLLAGLIATAREWAEHKCQRAFISQVWEASLDAWPCNKFITLPMPNMLSLTSVKYIDASGVEQTLSNSNFTVDDYGIRHSIWLGSNQTWPSISTALPNPIKIRYTCGFGVDADSVPACIKQWMLLRVEDMYKNRGAYVDGSMNELPYIDRLLDSVRVPVL